MWRRPAVTILVFVTVMILTMPLRAQQKHFTQEQVSSMVRDGFGDESGAKLIEQRGIDFAPSEDFLQSLKAAGASEAFLQALRAAKPPEPARAKKPLNQVQVFALLAGGVPSHRVAMLVIECGIDFEPQQEYLNEIRLGGGDDELVTALKSTRVMKPATVDPAAQARQAEASQHVARGTELEDKGRYAEAEQEYRAALLHAPEDGDIYASLAYVLLQQHKWGAAASAGREATRLNPDNDVAHANLGAALAAQGDSDGAIAEVREALRLNPGYDDWHVKLGAALTSEGDWDGAMAEYRTALRLNAKNEGAHVLLGLALANKGERDGAITEYRQALLMDPKDAEAHSNLGVELGSKGDLDGAIAEYGEALRLNPKNPLTHAGLGLALEQKGDRRGALEEYRAAYMLDPKDAVLKQKYEQLLRQVNQ